jgi:hypothetical protein
MVVVKYGDDYHIESSRHYLKKKAVVFNKVCNYRLPVACIFSPKVELDCYRTILSYDYRRTNSIRTILS